MLAIVSTNHTQCFQFDITCKTSTIFYHPVPIKNVHSRDIKQQLFITVTLYELYTATSRATIYYGDVTGYLMPIQSLFPCLEHFFPRPVLGFVHALHFIEVNFFIKTPQHSGVLLRLVVVVTATTMRRMTHATELPRQLKFYIPPTHSTSTKVSG